jgi:hypothetical protein
MVELAKVMWTRLPMWLTVKRPWGRFRALPWSWKFEAERKVMGQSIETLWRAWDASDDAFQFAYDDARSTVAGFTDAVGRHLLKSAMTRSRS